jgi:hypothetical protein
LGKIILDVLFGAIDYVLDYFMPDRKKLDRLMERGIFEKLRDSFLSDEDFRQKYSPKAEKQSFLQNSKEAGELFHKTALNPNGLKNNIMLASGSGGFGLQNASYVKRRLRPHCPQWRKRHEPDQEHAR